MHASTLELDGETAHVSAQSQQSDYLLGQNCDPEHITFEDCTGTAAEPASGLIAFYGGYEYRGTYNLVLEYADGGSLGPHFQQRSPIFSKKDVMLFWEDLFELIKCIRSIHAQQSGATGKVDHDNFDLLLQG